MSSSQATPSSDPPSPGGRPSGPAPPVFLRKLRRAAVAVGCDVRLRVVVGGHPRPSLHWYRNDVPLPADTQDYGGLWIRDCQQTDGGLYTCVAVNSLGEAQTSGTLAVLDLGEDSDNTDDENGESQVAMETKERSRVLQASQLPGGGKATVHHLSAPCDGPVVEREMQALGSRAPGLPDSLQPGGHASAGCVESPQVRHLGVEALVRASQISVYYPAVGSEESVSLASDYYGSVFSLYRQRTFSIYSVQDSLNRPHSRSQLGCLTRDAPPVIHTQPPPNAQSSVSASHFVSAVDSTAAHNGSKKLEEEAKLFGEAKPSGAAEHQSAATQGPVAHRLLPRTASKIFEKVRAFEQRRHSVDAPKSATGRAAPSGIGHRPSRDVEDGRKREGLASNCSTSAVALKRAMFKQRASSLEDRPSYAQKVQSFQCQFSEELQRIKKLVGRPNIKKAFSTENLSSALQQPAGKIEPIPPEVVAKCRNASEEKGSSAEVSRDLTVKEPSLQTARELISEVPESECRVSLASQVQPQLGKESQSGRQVGGHVSAAPGQRSPRTARKTRESRSPSPHAEQPQKEPKPSSPVSKAALSSLEDGGVQAPPKPPRVLTSSSASPRTQKGRAEKCPQHAHQGSPSPPFWWKTSLWGTSNPWWDIIAKKAPKLKRRCREQDGDVCGQQQLAIKKSPLLTPVCLRKRSQWGGPAFTLPLEDVVAAAGSEVTLECVIAGNPSQVTWRKGETTLRDGGGYAVTAEGGRHALRISSMRASDAGSYSVSAVGDGGRVAVCGATLFIQSEPVRTRSDPVTSDPVTSVPVTSDDAEEGIDFGVLSRTDAPRFKDPPRFQVGLDDQAVCEGDDVTMCVRVAGQPKPVICWQKDRMNFGADGHRELHELDNGRRSELKIKSARKIDAGIYTCKIINEYGTKQTECRLEVKDLPSPESLTLTRPVQDLRVRAGRTALFECHVSGPPDADVDWMANGKTIQAGLLDCKMHFDGRRCCLQLRSVHEEDRGCYTCRISTAKAEVFSSAQLTVTPSKEPLFTRKLEALEVMEGQSACFVCKVSGTPPPEVTWTHCDQPMVESENVRIVSEGGRHSLHLSHVSPDSEGLYTVTARNAHGQAQSSAELYVQEPRAAVSSQTSRLEKMPSIPEEPEVLEGDLERRTMPDFLKPLVDLEVLEGREAVLVCKVTGLPYPTINWYHNGQKIDSTDDRKMTQYRDVHSLVIRSACRAHSGVYKSVISNKVGKATCYAHLYVTDIVPEPPDGPPVVESITGRTITICWKKPKNLDPSIDSSCLMYTVQQQALGSIQWTTVASSLSETSYTVTALSKGVRYAFRVLSSTGRVFSKPSPPTDTLMLIDRGQYLKKAPVILEKPNTVHVVENQPVTITITLNHVQASVTWKRRGAALVNKPGSYEMFMPDDDQHSLKISRVKGADLGQLICMANNQYGSDLCTVLLAIAAPPAFETIMEDLDVCVGQTARFLVVVDAKPDPEILWYKDSVPLVESGHFSFVQEDRECSLVIPSVQPEDAGVFTCVAKNPAGEISCKAELTIHTAKEEEEEEEQLEDKGAILRRMRRLTDYYDIHKEIGRGAFSYVKRVTQKNGKQEYAAKFISTRVRGKTSALREMELLSVVDHQRILYFHDAFEKKNVVVLITELCREELLERLVKKTNILESEIRSCIRQILEGLAYLHQNDIIHLDIKPENILMSDRRSDQIKICDFGNARTLSANEVQYCTYGTPEYIAPEIVNQTPISKATDIWPVGVITYLCLTGVSPFAGENDRDTLLNIRSSNVAFEESMFAECREAKGFVIKLLMTDRLRPDATECLRHPWFKALTKGPSINTSLHKHTLARCKWQRSLISYKSKMAMRSIPELLDDSSSHVSLAVPRGLKEGSPAASSSSDSDEDIDELPFVPMPLTMMFSGSRMSLTEIHEDEAVAQGSSEGLLHRDLQENAGAVRHEPSGGEEDAKDRAETADGTERTELALESGSSVEAELVSTTPRRRLMRRGSSADSALLLHIVPEEGAASLKPSEEGQESMKKAVSMDLPPRSSSPGLGKLSQEDYALKLELLRQRLLRGGSMDEKMSGLRGPLFETLGMCDNKRSSLDCNLRRARLGGSAHTAPADGPGEILPKTKASRKSALLCQGELEPASLRRRSGAPLEIPSAEAGRCKTPTAASASAVPQETKMEAELGPPREHSERATSAPDVGDQQIPGEEGTPSMAHREGFAPCLLQHKIMKMGNEDEHSSPLHTHEGCQLPACILSHDKPSTSTVQPNAKHDASVKPIPASKISEEETSTEHPAVFATMSMTSAHPPTLRTDIKDIDSEEVFEARFKKRESSLTRGLKRLTKPRVEDKSPVLLRKTGEEVYRPGPTGAPLEFVSRGLQEKSKSFQDLREVDKDPGLGVIGRLSLRVKKNDRKEEKPKDESSASRRRVTWSLGRSKSLDKKATGTELCVKDGERDLQRHDIKVADSPVLAIRRKFESKVSGMSTRIRSKSQERKDSKEPQPEISTEAPNNEEKQDIKKVGDSPILKMRKKFSDSLLNRSHSEERGVEKEAKDERKRTPLLSRLRHSQSESIASKKMDIPENQLPSQTACAASEESLNSTSSTLSTKSSQTPERDRRSRWDRWGLSRGKRDRTPSQSSSPATPAEDHQYTRSASDFPPVFHIKLKDHTLLEGDPVTLICLPAGSPHPTTVWMKDKKPLHVDDRMNVTASPDGRHLVMILQTGQKDAGLYECVATNNLGCATTSCILTLANVPNRPGTPETPQVYNNTALVVWRPADNKSPCTHILERRREGESSWLVVAAGIADCYYNATDLPWGSSLRFRVACVNKAGQGPYSSVSEKVDIGHIPGEQMFPVAPPPPLVNTAAGTPGWSPSVPPSVPASDGPLQNTATAAPWRKTATPAPLLSGSEPQSPQTPAHSPDPKDAKQYPSVAISATPVAAINQLPPKVRYVPPLVPAKPNSPVNVVPPITQAAAQRSHTAPLSMAPPISPVPNYVPATSAQTGPTPVPPVVINTMNSISPIGDTAASAGPETPTGRVIPSGKSETVLKQGVPQKPYTFLDERGRGRFGVIRDCRENATGTMFMAKIVSYDQETKKTVLREYETLKSLHNERIMALHEAYVTPRYLVLITEHCMGKEVLYSLIDRFRYSEDDVAGYTVQVLQGLDYLHSCRILHLDIKPDNIMVTSTGVIKIIDFGSARSFNPLSPQRCSRDVGTLEYMAPEMLKGDAVGPPADVWSLGVLTYVMLSGRLPFQDKDPRQMETKIHAKFDPIGLYPNVSQSALAFLKKTLDAFPWSRPTAKDCTAHSWLQDSYLAKLRRQTLTFTTTRLKEFLGEHQRHRVESATRHKVLLRTYQGGPRSPASPLGLNPPSTSFSQ
ncbi:LOW QUALITY PROTEIN: striated muscle preferentially expressed protein kinase [Brachyhypopomus gauderio]|uniref:LOW QUALITY PROTEIN: striated muscle preferentially expressed protein kinase n=1 Tax=Brachyhypopomus gauderio TaxID=698409 RepID=UPI004042FF52